MREAGELLSAWSSFYVIIGSSAAALTGLMFVVITLISEERRGASEAGISTFSTPTVFHFCCALFTAALMAAPFRSLVPIEIIVGLAGAGGLFYVVRTAHRTAKLQTYRADAEDWAWNVLLPFVAYATLLIGAIALRAAPSQALYAPAAAVTLLIFVGIRNAWDVVTFLATGKVERLPDPPATGEPVRPPGSSEPQS